ncbi:OsmC family protein [Pelistega ratti]|uniref:OsmC family protein n=1 Tax=Pelistega ratti TaxID=2652177 RepID=UPI00135BDF12|nr:OsmC family protein [Pelistega ratti]
MNSIKVVYQGALQQQVTHLASGQQFLTDGPLAAGGKGELSAPTDLLVSALTTCAMTIMALKAESAGASFNGCYAESGKTVSMEDFSVVKIEITFYLKAAYSPELRQILESATTEMCIVGRSLHPSLEQKFNFIYQ